MKNCNFMKEIEVNEIEGDPKFRPDAEVGYAVAIKPVHTSADGDTIFYFPKGSLKVNQDALGDLRAYVMAKAINEGVKCAVSAYGFKAMCDLSEEEK